MYWRHDFHSFKEITVCFWDWMILIYWISILLIIDTCTKMPIQIYILLILLHWYLYGPSILANLVPASNLLSQPNFNPIRSWCDHIMQWNPPTTPPPHKLLGHFQATFEVDCPTKTSQIKLVHPDIIN